MKISPLLAVFLLPLTALAQNVKQVPPPGKEVPATDRAEIEAGVKQLTEAIAELRKNPKNEAELPNVEIFLKSADWAVRYNEIYDAKQIATAKKHLQQGLERAAALAKGQTPWNTQTGQVVRGYRSKIDGSVQPYGLFVPKEMAESDKTASLRLDFWFHGRAENLTELAFIESMQHDRGPFTPPKTFVCQLYGRLCNANKFAGERDLFEVLEDLKQHHFPIDEQKIAVRGFSMGGAACWQFATHHAQLWAAVAPGAGFAETAEYAKVLAPGKQPPPPWEQTLWRWYDCTTMAANLANTSTVAYSGEIDGQKQAADIMVRYAEKEGITFPHIIGPKMGHGYEPGAKAQVAALVDAAAEKGREGFPRKQRWVTYTLIYPGSRAGMMILRMGKEWERAEMNAELDNDGQLTITTSNVDGFSIQGFDKATPRIRTIVVDGQPVTQPFPTPGLVLYKKEGKWPAVEVPPKGSPGGIGPHKDIQLCGPIDHAFMSKFVFVRPTGKPLNEAVGAWAKAEMERAIEQWRRVFRGEVEVLDDTEWLKRNAKGEDFTVDRENIVLWGDPSSNKVLAGIIDKLPLKWDAKTLTLGTQTVDASHHAPVMIFPFPDPLRRRSYLVLNSGFTFREAANVSNSDQTPKLPDWALVDLNTPPGPKWPGKIVDAGFFDEKWQVSK